MNMATSIPQHHVTACYTVNVITQVFIRTKDNLLVLWEALHNLLGITAGNHNIRYSLGGSCSIYVAYYRMTGMCLHEGFKLLSRTTLGQRTGSIQIRNQHHLVRTENFVGLSHKVNAAHYYDVCIRLGSFLSQRQTVTNKICYILYFTVCVIVCHNNGILLLTHPFYFSLNIYTFWDRFIDVALFLPLFINHILLYLFFFLFKIKM